MNNKIIVSVKGGKLIATPSSDPNYPGIDIEFITDDDDNTSLSNPRVLVEQPCDSTQIRALIWNNHLQEDYTEEIKLWHLDGEKLPNSNVVSSENNITPQKAIYLLNSIKSELLSDALKSAIDLATKSLEKEISKNPDFEGDGYDDQGNLVYDTWICPNCGYRYEVDYEEYERCPKCGQAINENAFSD